MNEGYDDDSPGREGGLLGDTIQNFNNYNMRTVDFGCLYEINFSALCSWDVRRLLGPCNMASHVDKLSRNSATLKGFLWRE